MSCRHSDPINNPGCSSYRTPEQQLGILDAQKEAVRKRFKLPDSPDSEWFEILDAKDLNGHVVLKVQYPNCRDCSYEGTKVLVYRGVTMLDVLKWRVIDPHFREPDPNRPAREAPGPTARFPASREGEEDAYKFAFRCDV